MKEELILKQERALDELADEVVELVANSKKMRDILRTAQETEVIQKRNLGEITTLKNRITNLENRLDKLIKSFKINTVEAERLVSEKYEELNHMNEQTIMNLQGQMEDLRSAMIRLSNEVKKIKS